MTSPFSWREERRPSIFATDTTFTGKSNGRTTSQIATEAVEKKRLEGKSPGTIPGIINEFDELAAAREHFHRKRAREDAEDRGRPESVVAVHQIGPSAFAKARAEIDKIRKR